MLVPFSEKVAIETGIGVDIDMDPYMDKDTDTQDISYDISNSVCCDGAGTRPSRPADCDDSNKFLILQWIST